jgi:hypothetical protein
MRNLIKYILSRLVKYVASKDDTQGGVWLSKIIMDYEKSSSNFVNYKLYPKSTTSFEPLKIKTTTQEGEFAILLQGPIDIADSFTVETIRLYKTIFPSAYIIVSTWDDTTRDVVEQIQALGAYVVINQTFEENGYRNINYQICTTLSGIKKAKELGANFVLKTRTDWRIYREYSLEFLKSLIISHPINNPVNPLNLKGRIISGGGGSMNFCMPYCMSDFIYFGYTDDLLNMFDVPYDHRTIKDARQFNKDMFGDRYSGKDLVYLSMPEIYIVSSFIEKYLKEDRTIENHWKNLKNYFMIIDPDMINAYWHKYDYVKNLSRGDFWNGKNNNDSFRQFRYVDYMNIYSGAYQYDESYETFMNGKIVRT